MLKACGLCVTVNQFRARKKGESEIVQESGTGAPNMCIYIYIYYIYIIIYLELSAIIIIDYFHATLCACNVNYQCNWVHPRFDVIILYILLQWRVSMYLLQWIASFIFVYANAWNFDAFVRASTRATAMLLGWVTYSDQVLPHGARSLATLQGLPSPPAKQKVPSHMWMLDCGQWAQTVGTDSGHVSQIRKEK